MTTTIIRRCKWLPLIGIFAATGYIAGGHRLLAELAMVDPLWFWGVPAAWAAIMVGGVFLRPRSSRTFMAIVFLSAIITWLVVNVVTWLDINDQQHRVQVQHANTLSYVAMRSPSRFVQRNRGIFYYLREQIGGKTLALSSHSALPESLLSRIAHLHILDREYPYALTQAQEAELLGRPHRLFTYGIGETETPVVFIHPQSAVQDDIYYVKAGQAGEFIVPASCLPSEEGDR